MENKYVAPYILENEYVCHHCKRLPPGFIKPGTGLDVNNPFIKLFQAFETLRVSWDKPIPVRSGYRCAFWNAKVKGAKLSVHLFGLALDLLFKDIPERSEFCKLIFNKMPELRVGIYKYQPNIVHIDVGYLINPIATEAWRRGARWES